MSIIGRPMPHRVPLNPDNFKTTDDMVAYLLGNVFSSAEPGQPFFLVTRLYRYELPPLARAHDEYEDVLSIEYYAGSFFPDANKPVVRYAPQWVCGGAILFPTERYLKADGREWQPRSLEIFLGELDRTPLKEPFEAHDSLGIRRLGKVSAFTFATGQEAMEAVALEEGKRDSRLGEWCVGTMRELGLVPAHPELVELEAGYRIEALIPLIEVHAQCVEKTVRDEPIEKSLREKAVRIAKRAHRLGLAELKTDLAVKGIRVIPSLMLEFLKRLEVPAKS